MDINTAIKKYKVRIFDENMISFFLLFFDLYFAIYLVEVDWSPKSNIVIEAIKEPISAYKPKFDWPTLVIINGIKNNPDIFTKNNCK